MNLAIFGCKGHLVPVSFKRIKTWPFRERLLRSFSSPACKKSKRPTKGVERATLPLAEAHWWNAFHTLLYAEEVDAFLAFRRVETSLQKNENYHLPYNLNFSVAMPSVSGSEDMDGREDPGTEDSAPLELHMDPEHSHSTTEEIMVYGAKTKSIVTTWRGLPMRLLSSGKIREKERNTYAPWQSQGQDRASLPFPARWNLRIGTMGSWNCCK